VLLLSLSLVSCRKAATPRSVEINWTAPAQPLSYYEVYRSTHPGDYDLSKPYASHIEGTRFIDSNVVEGQTYYYRVLSVHDSSTGVRRSVLSEETMAYVAKQ
jgi:hypothetical protein